MFLFYTASKHLIINSDACSSVLHALLEYMQFNVEIYHYNSSEILNIFLIIATSV